MQPGRTCGGVTQDLPGIALAGWGIGQGPVRDDVRNLVLEMGMAHAQGAEDTVLAKDPQALPGGASYDLPAQAVARVGVLDVRARRAIAVGRAAGRERGWE